MLFRSLRRSGNSLGAWDSRMFLRVLQLVIGMYGLCGMVAAATVSSALANPIPEDQRWATITHPGNAPWQPAEYSNYMQPMGRVDYEYQIGRTEVTGGEWFEFVQAYAPYVAPVDAWGTAFTSWYVTPHDTGTGTYTYTLSEFGRNRPVWISWRFAARYVNWLHNDKALTQDAFENGAYDTSTFAGNFAVGFTDQLAHNPDARYWIPTIDEWVKAAHWDPDRHGPGQPGYWPYAYGSETFPVTGLPGQPGAETSAGRQWSAGTVPEVAAYYDSQSPWGLWDTSGGRTELLETPLIRNGALKYRFVRGTEARYYSIYMDYFEHIDYTDALDPFSGNSGLRIARAVPGPGACWGIPLVVAALYRRNRRCHGTCSRSCCRSSFFSP